LPKENTHLFFADRLVRQFPDPDIRLLLQDNRHAFFLGAVLPDAFFYHPRKDVVAVSRRLHGMGDTPGDITGAFILGARKDNTLPDLAFAMGYLSHCFLDMAFHPTVRMLTGDYNDPDSDNRRTARYRHRLIETALDRQINTGCRVDRMIALGHLSGLASMRILSERTGVARKRLQRAYILQHRANSLFQKKWAYRVVRILQETGKPDLKIILPLFYAHLDVDACEFPETVTVPAHDEEEERQGGIKDLLDAAAASAAKTFDAAFRLYKDNSASACNRLQDLIPHRF